MLEIIGVPVLSDNYVWVMHHAPSGDTVAVDPGAAEPVIAAAAERGWRISQIWNTHWHDDHVAGNAEIKAATGCLITAPNDRLHPIPGVDTVVGEGDRVSIGTIEGHVLATPGHTKVHMSYYVPDASVVFSGDALFALGCGRLLEGSALEMFTTMGRFSDLPPSTAVYCAHEYTQSNGRFSLTVEPHNLKLAERMADVDRKRARGEPTIPTTIGVELDGNPFMRASSLEEFASRRAAKDGYRG